MMLIVYNIMLHNSDIIYSMFPDYMPNILLEATIYMLNVNDPVLNNLMFSNQEQGKSKILVHVKSLYSFSACFVTCQR